MAHNDISPAVEARHNGLFYLGTLFGSFFCSLHRSPFLRLLEYRQNSNGNSDRDITIHYGTGKSENASESPNIVNLAFSEKAMAVSACTVISFEQVAHAKRS